MSFDLKRVLKRELNIGEKERKLRLYGGAGALFVSVFLGNIPLLLIGGVLVGTSVLRWCPIYSGLGRSTAEPGEQAASGGAH